MSGVYDLYASQYQTTAAMAALSTSLYGFNVALAVGCIRFLMIQKDLLSRTRLSLTCLYIALMIAFASQAVVSVNLRLVNGMRSYFSPQDGSRRVFLDAIFDPAMPKAFPLAIWGADALLIYRCAILYRLVDRRRRIVLYACLCLLTLTSFGSGVAAYVLDTRGFQQLIQSGIAPLTIIVNGTVSCLIAARLIYAAQLFPRSQHGLSDPGEKHQSNPYMTALAICVESSVVIAAAALTAIKYQEFIVVIPQISVLAPLLIIYRVAQGRTEEAVAQLEATIAFNHTQFSTEMS